MFPFSRLTCYGLISAPSMSDIQIFGVILFTVALPPRSLFYDCFSRLVK